MYNTGKVLLGIIVFICFFAIPFWLNLGKVSALPKPELPKDEKKCIEDVQYMKAYHMKLLDKWRKEKVREGNINYINNEGKIYKMSLQRTCMKCHTSKEKFCDRCHTTLVTHPDCWDCHIAPEEVKKWQ
ncbi:cytochrome C [Caldimicrobium thiodismutans]|uniref:Cytochrome C n=1 Tax=Caldimicrobium thiodismutans TaxID=1653476 RepID=A0A0U4W1I0_9BACT|nr:sulfate reduction electron transfer complex DsrMKJOP subunit DsrJ [Caldimicrobium thiodismutans]BAU22986.1 cytochrome C [Caldimicrobium thiodismutans]